VNEPARKTAQERAARKRAVARSLLRGAAAMKSYSGQPSFTRLAMLLAPWLMLVPTVHVHAQADPLPSWNDGPAKRAILTFVRATTEPKSPDFVPEAERIATFDQDGTLWVEQPVYKQLIYALGRVPQLVEAKPELAQQEPFKTVLAGKHEAIAKLSLPELAKILAATLTGMSLEVFEADVAKWLASYRDPRWKRTPTELTYEPMHELLGLLRAHGYKTYIVTGGGQDFVRVYAAGTYGIGPEQVVGSAGETKFEHAKDGAPVLRKQPKLLLLDDGPGKPEGIHLMIGRRPRAAFGNSSGDQQMLEYTKAGTGARLAMLVLHDDAAREFAYGPALGLPASKVGSFPQELYDQAGRDGWIVISMKNDWKRIFSFPATSKQP
jgi:phosphoglycolate phosphatase-like HAD superfamily hydrolase